ncbi:MAG: nitrate reductase [Pseudomonadota bacterium]
MLQALYGYARGPLAWAAFGLFIGGIILKLMRLYALSLKKDQVIYDHLSISWALRSIVAYLLPLNRSVASKPIFSAIAYMFHICLIAAPLLVMAHAELMYESWGVSLPYIKDAVVDVMAVVVMLTGLALLVRRFIDPTVRLLTTPTDIALLLATIAPFATGFLAYHQLLLPYDLAIVLHLLSAELVLALIPFTKLSHFALFFVTRGLIGSEFGGRRATRAW